MSKNIKFAVIGCGRIAPKHIEVLTHLEGAEVCGLYDADKSVGEKCAAKYGLKHFASESELISKSQPDAITILTPSGDHPKTVIRLAEHSLPLIVEKPMALALEDADKMIDTCSRHNTRLFIVKQNRYNAPIRELRRALEAGRFGQLVLGTVRVRWCRDQKYYDQDPWRGTWEMDGGVLANQASHHIDMLLWMMGQVEKVTAMASTRLVNIEVDNTSAAVVQFTSGALGVIEATTATRPKDLEGSISILGEKGSVEIAGFAMNEIRHWEFTTPAPEDAEIKERSRTNPPTVYGFGHMEFYRNVLESIRTGGHSPGIVEGLEGRRSLELINAIYESVETGKSVNLVFRPRRSKMGMKRP